MSSGCGYVCVCVCIRLFETRPGACLISGSDQSRNMDKLLLLNPALSLGVSVVSSPELVRRSLPGSDFRRVAALPLPPRPDTLGSKHPPNLTGGTFQTLGGLLVSSPFRELVSLFSEKGR